MVIDLEKVCEAIEYDDYIILFYGSDHIPAELKITGEDFQIMHRYFEEDNKEMIRSLMENGFRKEGDRDKPLSNQLKIDDHIPF